MPDFIRAEISTGGEVGVSSYVWHLIPFKPDDPNMTQLLKDLVSLSFNSGHQVYIRDELLLLVPLGRGMWIRLVLHQLTMGSCTQFVQSFMCHLIWWMWMQSEILEPSIPYSTRHTKLFHAVHETRPISFYQLWLRAVEIFYLMILRNHCYFIYYFLFTQVLLNTKNTPTT